MMRSLFSGVSGLKSHQTRMDVIGNNISNVNTVGFKSSRVTFADMLSQTQTGASSPTGTRGGTNPKQIGLGTSVASVDLIFNDGSPQSTGKNTDIALSGNGLFVVKDGTQTYYTRDGAFEFDAQGNYVLPGSGYLVQGWNAVEGVLTTTGPTTNIVVPAGRTMEAAATTEIDYTGNLNASSLTIKGITYTAGTGDATKVVNDSTITEVKYYDSDGNELTTAPANGEIDGVTCAYADVSYKVNDSDAEAVTIRETSGKYEVGNTVHESVNVDGKNVISATLTMSDGSTVPVTSGFYELGHSIPVTTIVTVYDAEGKQHAVTVLLDKDPLGADPGNPTATDTEKDNRWRVYIAPEEGMKGTATTYRVTEDDGSQTDGNLNYTSETAADGTVTTSTSMSYIYFNNDGTYNGNSTSGGSVYLEYSNGNGASNTTSSIVFSGLTQYSGNSTAYPTADGNVAGILQSVSIDTSGVMTGTYTNGMRRAEAQVAVAQFTNASGLTKIGNSLYQSSNNSGTANVRTVTDLGLTITPSALEMSNVDIANEFADMIITQRGFQSNSKIITVGDEMLETIVNMKR